MDVVGCKSRYREPFKNGSASFFAFKYCYCRHGTDFETNMFQTEFHVSAELLSPVSIRISLCISDRFARDHCKSTEDTGQYSCGEHYTARVEDGTFV